MIDLLSNAMLARVDVGLDDWSLFYDRRDERAPAARPPRDARTAFGSGAVVSAGRAQESRGRPLAFDRVAIRRRNAVEHRAGDR